jgi:hypothetical protein
MLARLLLDHGRVDHRPIRTERSMMSDKIRQHHLERRAILYLRQCSSHQVLHNRESRALQYAIRERLTALGWFEIEIIDDDLGRSAAGGVTRAGFERMVAEVCLGKAGAVAAREVSRFARNSRDWQQLIEMCGLSTPCWSTRRRPIYRVTATIGLSTPCWSTRRRPIYRVTATIDFCWDSTGW